MTARRQVLENLLSRVQARAQEPRRGHVLGPESLTYEEPNGSASGAPSETFAEAEPTALRQPPEDAAMELQTSASTADQDRAPVSSTSNPLVLDSPSIIPPEPDSMSFEELPREEASSEAGPPSLPADSVEFDDVPESGPVSSPSGSRDFEQTASPITPPPESVEEAVSTPVRRASAQPTMEQLGQTVDLDEGEPSSTLELDEPTIEDEQAASLSSPVSVEPEPNDAISTSEVGTVRRPSIKAPVVELRGTRTAVARSFADVLDSSLRL